MPSRLATIAIVVFWFGTTAWMMYRELAPRWNSGEPPNPFPIDMSDEVKRRITILWDASHKGDRVGTASTTITRKPQGMYEIEFKLSLKGDTEPTTTFGKMLSQVKLAKCSKRLVVTRSGHIREFSQEFSGTIATARFHVKTWGTVSNDLVVDPNYEYIRIGENNVRQEKGESFSLAKGDDALTTEFAIHRIEGLRNGRQWRVPPHPLMSKLMAEVLTRVLPIGPLPAKPELIARTSSDTIEWQGEKVKCWRITFAKPKELDLEEQKRDMNLDYWVRRKDGLIIRQEGTVMGRTLTYQRKR